MSLGVDGGGHGSNRQDFKNDLMGMGSSLRTLLMSTVKSSFISLLLTVAQVQNNQSSILLRDMAFRASLGEIASLNRPRPCTPFPKLSNPTSTRPYAWVTSTF